MLLDNFACHLSLFHLLTSLVFIVLIPGKLDRLFLLDLLDPLPLFFGEFPHLI
jgi:hypothetical protein